MYLKNSRNYGNLLIIYKDIKIKSRGNAPFKAYINQTKNEVDIFYNS